MESDDPLQKLKSWTGWSDGQVQSLAAKVDLQIRQRDEAISVCLEALASIAILNHGAGPAARSWVIATQAIKRTKALLE